MTLKIFGRVGPINDGAFQKVRSHRYSIIVYLFPTLLCFPQRQTPAAKGPVRRK